MCFTWWGRYLGKNSRRGIVTRNWTQTTPHHIKLGRGQRSTRQHLRSWMPWMQKNDLLRGGGWGLCEVSYCKDAHYSCINPSYSICKALAMCIRKHRIQLYFVVSWLLECGIGARRLTYVTLYMFFRGTKHLRNMLHAINHMKLQIFDSVYSCIVWFHTPPTIGKLEFPQHRCFIPLVESSLIDRGQLILLGSATVCNTRVVVYTVHGGTQRGS